VPLHRRWNGEFDYALATDPSGSTEFTHRASLTLAYSLAPPREMDIEQKSGEAPEQAEEVPENIDEGKP
jgi:hypothetical protein